MPQNKQKTLVKVEDLQVLNHVRSNDQIRKISADLINKKFNHYLTKKSQFDKMNAKIGKKPSVQQRKAIIDNCTDAFMEFARQFNISFLFCYKPEPNGNRLVQFNPFWDRSYAYRANRVQVEKLIQILSKVEQHYRNFLNDCVPKIQGQYQLKNELVYSNNTLATFNEYCQEVLRERSSLFNAPGALTLFGGATSAGISYFCPPLLLAEPVKNFILCTFLGTTLGYAADSKESIYERFFRNENQTIEENFREIWGEAKYQVEFPAQNPGHGGNHGVKLEQNPEPLGNVHQLVNNGLAN